MSSTFGTLFKLTTFGESHGEAIGGIIDGVPANIELDIEGIQAELNRRKPGQSAIVSERKETDAVRVLSGMFDGKTTGAPIGFIVKNEDQKSEDYNHLEGVFRPSHADFSYDKKYGIRDHRGGGRSSARETVCRVVGGAIARQILANLGIEIIGYVDQIGPIKLGVDIDYNLIEENAVRCPNAEVALRMEKLIREVKSVGDSIGGCVKCVIKNVPAGLGEPVFDKLHAELGKAMLSINAVKGFEVGSGFSAAEMIGSEHNDLFNEDGSTRSNDSGGVQGGISNGMPIEFRVAFKPVATILREQETLNAKGELIQMQGKGRHDPCVVPRAVPIVEAMAALTILDFYLRNKAAKLSF